VATRIDLHNHSCLSPCASLELSPRRLAKEAAAKGIQVLALTDHNSALNCPAFAAACAQYAIVPLFGLELCTREELHLLALFSSLEAALGFGKQMYALLPPFPNDPERLGDQVQVDEDEYIQQEVPVYLGAALDLGVDEAGSCIRDAGGLPIPAHIDRPSWSMTSQLGFVAEGPWAALECLRLPPPSVDTRGYPLICSSDAHWPEQVGSRSFNADCTLADIIESDRISLLALEEVLKGM
jgi:3',5'-nucleoside bisphosphate phosphatase